MKLECLCADLEPKAVGEIRILEPDWTSRGTLTWKIAEGLNSQKLHSPLGQK